MANFDYNRNYGIEIEFSWNGRCPNYATIARAITEAGVPCEAQGYNHTTARTWKIVPDGSVSNGGELVSPILNGLDGKEQLRTVLRAIKELGAKTDRSCGIHVHHDAGDMNGKALANVAELYKTYEPVIDLFISEARRSSANHPYCGSMNNNRTDYYAIGSHRAYANFSVASSQDLKTRLIQGDYANGLRGLSVGRVNVNFSAYLRHGTVEFRQHQSSLNVNKIWSWVVFTQTIMTVAKSHRGKITGRTVNTGPEATRALRGLLREMGMRKARDYDTVTLDAYKRLMKRIPREMRVNYRNGDAVNDNRDGMETPVVVVEADTFPTAVVEDNNDDWSNPRLSSILGQFTVEDFMVRAHAYNECNCERNGTVDFIGHDLDCNVVERASFLAENYRNFAPFIVRSEVDVACNCSSSTEAGERFPHQASCDVIQNAEMLEQAALTS